MEISTLYFLSRLHALCNSLLEKEVGSFSRLYRKIIDNTEADIVAAVPAEILAAAEELCTEPSQQKLSSFILQLSPFEKECRAYLPELSEANLIFTNALADDFCDNGYFIKGGVFRKSRRNRLFLIEAELTADFAADKRGNVTAVRICPLVRIADAPLKKHKDKTYRTQSGILDDDATVSDIKFCEKQAFYKNLRHLQSILLPIEHSRLSEEQIKEIAESAKVASAVCENRAIPAYYKRLCKKDFPFKKALTLSLITAFISFVLLTAIIGIASGLIVLAVLRFTRIFGLFTVPYFYLVTGIIALIYGYITFRKLRSGRF